MGGRGSSSGLTSNGGTTGISVTRNGETSQYYFTTRNGVNYYQQGVGGLPEPTPQNMSQSEFRKRVEGSGASVKNISAKEKKAEENKRSENRKKTEAFLDRAYTSDREMVRGSRTSRIANRQSKK